MQTQLTKVTCIGHITSSRRNLDQISSSDQAFLVCMLFFCWALPSFEMIISGALENIRAPILDLFLLLQNEPHVDEVDDVHIDKCLSGCRQTRTALCLCVIVIWSNHNGCWRTQPHFITISVN